MSFPYSINIPFPTNSPSTDVGPMQVNTNTIAAWTNVDHIGLPAGATGGKHKQVSFISTTGPGVIASDNSIIYPRITPNSPVAPINATVQAFFTNANSNVMLSGLKAFGVITVPAVSTPSVTPGMAYNVTSISSAPSSGNFNVTITLVSGCIAAGSTSSNTAVFLQTANSTQCTMLGTSSVSGNVITISGINGNAVIISGLTFSFAVIQN